MFSRKLVCSLFAAIVTVCATSAPTQAQTANQGTFGNLIAALNNISVQAENLEVLNDLIDGGVINIGDVDVTVVNVEDVLNGNRVRALNNVLRNVDIDIQDVLNDNVVILNLLNLTGVVIDDVIAITVLETGDLLVFVLD